MAQERIAFNLDGSDKKAFQELTEKLGLSITTALNLYVKDSIREQRLAVNLSLDPLTIADSPERIALNQLLDDRQKIIDDGNPKNFTAHKDVKEMIGL